MKLLKRDLVNALSTRTGESKASCSRIITALATTVRLEVRAGDAVSIPGLGVFERKLRDARAGVNPATGASITIDATYKPVFRPAKPFREAMPRVKRRAKP